MKRALAFYNKSSTLLSNPNMTTEESNCMCRALICFVNYPKNKKFFLKKMSQELVDIHSNETRIEFLKNQMVEIFSTFEDGSEQCDAKLRDENGVIFCDVVDSTGKTFSICCDKIFKSDIKSYVTLHFLEKGLCPRNGQSWSYSYTSLKPYLSKYSCEVDAFSSSENNMLSRYMSLFSTYDPSPFCLGNFLKDDIPSASYYVNPPYNEYILKKAVEKIMMCLSSDKGYGFLIVVPSWEDSEFWQYLLHSRYRKDFYTHRAPKDRTLTVKSGKYFFSQNFDVDIFYLTNV